MNLPSVTEAQPPHDRKSRRYRHRPAKHPKELVEAESFFAELKNEEATSTYETKAETHAAIASCTHGFYNPTRLHSTLDNLSPNDYAAKFKQAA